MAELGDQTRVIAFTTAAYINRDFSGLAWLSAIVIAISLIKAIASYVF